MAASLGVSLGAVSAAEQRARQAGLDWPNVETLNDEALELRLYGASARRRRPLPDPVYLHSERKRPGVTLELLHQEYLERHPDGYAHTQFCEPRKPRAVAARSDGSAGSASSHVAPAGQPVRAFSRRVSWNGQERPEVGAQWITEDTGARDPLFPEVLFDGREVGVDVAEPSGQVSVDKVQIQSQ